MTGTENNPTKERDRVYAYLTNQIINRKLQAGDILNERQVAKELEISRTPVREAIHQMETEGWVTVVPWKGIFIREMTTKQVDEVYQIRMKLESLSVELAAAAMTEEFAEELEKILEQQYDSAGGDFSQEFIRLDILFHNTIALCAGNELLQQMLGVLDRQLWRTGIQAVQDKKRYQETLDEHRKIVEALKHGAAEEAVEVMCAHLSRTHENLVHQLADIKE